MKVFRKIVLTILIICVSCNSMPIYAFAELVSSAVEADVVELGLNVDGNSGTDKKEKNDTKDEEKSVVDDDSSAKDGDEKSDADTDKNPSQKDDEESDTDIDKNSSQEEDEKSNTDNENSSAKEDDEKSVKDESSVTDEGKKSATGKDESLATDKNEKKDSINKEESEEAEDDVEADESISEDSLEDDEEEENDNTEISSITTPNKGISIIAEWRSEHGIGWKNELHFIVNHIHSTVLTKNEENEEYEENETGSYNVVIEGYIKSTEKGYSVSYVDENGNEIDNKEYAGYIGSFSSATGTVTLKANPITSDGKLLEHFTAFSVSAGHEATTINDENQEISIQYSPSVHLVKMDVFYVNENMIVVGAGSDDAVFGTDEQSDEEQDTSWVYTYINDGDGHHAGEIVKRTDTNQPIHKGENLPDNLVEGENVQLTKVYSTLEGLHTDKTVSKIEGEYRKFTIDLESWFSGAKAADIGLILDASGSMIFTSDTLKPINIEDLKNEDLKNQLRDKALKSGAYGDEGPSTEEWEEKIFLTEDEVNQILNYYNTDNNPLGNSGYNYYVFNENKDVNEYAPLGYWDGSLNDDLYDSLIGYYKFEKGEYEDNRRDWLKNSITGEEAQVVNQIEASKLKEETKEDVSFEIGDKPENWSEDQRLKFDGKKGVTVKNLEGGLGILLDVKPSTNNFTISFTVQKEKDTNEYADKGTSSVSQNYIDLVYVGPLENIKSSEYYRAIREGSSEGSTSGTGNSKNRLKGLNSNGELITSTNDVFKSTETPHTVTLVFEDGKVTSYLDGEEKNDANSNNLELTDRNIIITGFDNDYDGALIHIDDVRVYDAALSATDVKRIGEEKKSEYYAYNTYGEDVVKIASINSNFVDTENGKGGMSGWYYINHNSDWSKYTSEEIESAKIIWGISPSSEKEEIIYTDSITPPDDVNVTHKSTGYTYKPENSSPTLFYVDADGYLCCFHTRGTKKDTVGASFVYKKDDEDDIKLEALQHAIGSFASKLDEASPNSKVSAVRYNLDLEKEDTNAESDYDKFVLLDWTDDTGAIQSFMSLKYGDGGTITGTNSSTDNTGITQYNYGVTGGTSTYVGFEAYDRIFKERADEDSEKYLIVFTDGKDTGTETQREQVRNIAKNLKEEEGYTILGVMLTGGSIKDSGATEAEYKEAKSFLLSFVGTKDTTTEDEAEKYFFSTAEVEKNKGSNIDTLTEIFTNELLELISDNLDSYTVQDYIDPRFNLISSTGREYKLDANGIVTILNDDGSMYAKYNLKNGEKIQNPSSGSSLMSEDESSKKYYLSVKLSNDIDVDAPRARLFFDENNNMYYLKWVDQTIPGCVPDVNRLSVWNARITVKAKDDFIGGNAVLTNGNEAKMNYVYKEGDENASSGTDDAIRTEDDNVFPSKGFPRVTVNIPTPSLEVEGSETIYMGESLDYSSIKEKLIEQIKEETNEQLILNYLEYLDRYGKKEGKEGSYYLNELLNKGSLELDYSYLPNTEETNATGNEEHETDILGKLKYTIDIEDDELGDGDEIHDSKDRKLTLTVTYAPFEDHSNEELVKEGVYEWDETYKPVVGDPQVEKNVITSEYNIDIVSGEIAFQIMLNRQMLEVLEGKKIDYEIDLYRTYNGVEEKVGTFNATYDNADSEIIPDENGNVIITAQLDYSQDYMQKGGLPLGTYTVKDPKIITAPSYIKFEQINNVEDVNRYVENLFTLGTGNEIPQDYLAIFPNNTEITLGNKEDEDYLEERFGIFEVTPIAVFEMPLSGSNSLIKLYITIGMCIISAIILGKSTKVKGKRRK